MGAAQTCRAGVTGGNRPRPVRKKRWHPERPSEHFQLLFCHDVAPSGLLDERNRSEPFGTIGNSLEGVPARFRGVSGTARKGEPRTENRQPKTEDSVPGLVLRSGVGSAAKAGRYFAEQRLRPGHKARRECGDRHHRHEHHLYMLDDTLPYHVRLVKTIPRKSSRASPAAAGGWAFADKMPAALPHAAPRGVAPKCRGRLARVLRAAGLLTRRVCRSPGGSRRLRRAAARSVTP